MTKSRKVLILIATSRPNLFHKESQTPPRYISDKNAKRYDVCHVQALWYLRFIRMPSQ